MTQNGQFRSKIGFFKSKITIFTEIYILSWTQNVTLFLYDFMGSTSVSLLQGLGLEVNGIPVRTPYNGNGVSIVKQRHNVRLTTNYIGLRLEYPFPASVFWILSKDFNLN